MIYIVKLQLNSKLKSTQLNLNNLRDELGADAIFTVSPPIHHHHQETFLWQMMHQN